MLELDCQLTKDEEVVVSHDNDLLRSTGVAKKISELTYDELPQYLDQLDVTFAFGECFAIVIPCSSRIRYLIVVVLNPRSSS